AVPSAAAQVDPAVGNDADAATWLEFTNALRRCRRVGEKESREQPSWQGHLLNLVGARQGQADMVHAIDVMRLKPALDKTVTAWEFVETLPNPAGVVDFATVRTTYSDVKRLSTAVQKAQRRFCRWRDRTLTWLGEGFDKDAIVRDAKETVEAAKAA